MPVVDEHGQPIPIVPIARGRARELLKDWRRPWWLRTLMVALSTLWILGSNKELAAAVDAHNERVREARELRESMLMLRNDARMEAAVRVLSERIKTLVDTWEMNG